MRAHDGARRDRACVHRDGPPDRVVLGCHRRPPRPAPHTHPPSDLGVGRNDADRLDRDRSYTHQAFAPRPQPVRVVQLLDRHARHVPRRLPRGMALRRRDPHRRLEQVQARAFAGRVRPGDHFRLDEPDLRLVRCAATRAVAAARLSGHHAARGRRRSADVVTSRRRSRHPARHDPPPLINGGVFLRGGGARSRAAPVPRGMSACRRRARPSRP